MGGAKRNSPRGSCCYSYSKRRAQSRAYRQKQSWLAESTRQWKKEQRRERALTVGLWMAVLSLIGIAAAVVKIALRCL